MKRLAYIPLIISVLSCASPVDKKINEVQIIGSHNSYKQAIEPNLYAYLEEKDTTDGIQTLEYTHIPIPEQLSMGLRNLEIDVYIDTEGGRYAHPKGLDLVDGDSNYDPEGKMLKPGFKMLHVLDIDFRTSYYTLKDCLEAMKSWSEQHPDHSPVFITLEPKDGETNRWGTTPEPYTAAAFDELDRELISGLGEEHLITPDMVRGDHETLEQAVLAGNWPSASEGRGRFMFILDNNGSKRELYKQDHPNLESRVLFINAPQGTPEAAAMIINDPHDASIPELVKQGYIIRTRADAGTKQARDNDYSDFEAAKQSGAHIITTDYYVPSTLFKSEYHVSFEGDTFERENPILK
ncbi:phosphatidylinositol-specific phospholipase C1-like protein [Fulvivirga ligni]|uniref:phosphatidylinositol-specific phospholipase C1-like protein n=1 Tax=Fulvivirga ligni TaxID=2904246 RepID=UPI001F3CB8CA|nr:phosphatidylinositol-specific phospholipase C1-like protein [Fulvivirga ligni]UII19592.1 phosphatidylinositol-specific phospholipase C1-like protein [Fulvivirga ligni]